MKHPHAVALEALYESFTRGDAAGVLSHGADAFTFQIEGKSPLAGKYGRDTLAGFFAKQRELADGTYKLEIHDVMASDLHAVVLCSETVARGDTPSTLRMAHVWRFQNGKPLAGYAYARDLYQFDAAWA